MSTISIPLASLSGREPQGLICPGILGILSNCEQILDSLLEQNNDTVNLGVV